MHFQNTDWGCPVRLMFRLILLFSSTSNVISNSIIGGNLDNWSSTRNYLNEDDVYRTSALYNIDCTCYTNCSSQILNPQLFQNYLDERHANITSRPQYSLQKNDPEQHTAADKWESLSEYTYEYEYEYEHAYKQNDWWWWTGDSEDVETIDEDDYEYIYEEIDSNETQLENTPELDSQTVKWLDYLWDSKMEDTSEDDYEEIDPNEETQLKNTPDENMALLCLIIEGELDNIIEARLNQRARLHKKLNSTTNITILDRFADDFFVEQRKLNIEEQVFEDWYSETEFCDDFYHIFPNFEAIHELLYHVEEGHGRMTYLTTDQTRFDCLHVLARGGWTKMHAYGVLSVCLGGDELVPDFAYAIQLAQESRDWDEYDDEYNSGASSSSSSSLYGIVCTVVNFESSPIRLWEGFLGFALGFTMGMLLIAAYLAVLSFSRDTVLDLSRCNLYGVTPIDPKTTAHTMVNPVSTFFETRLGFDLRMMVQLIIEGRDFSMLKQKRRQAVLDTRSTHDAVVTIPHPHQIHSLNLNRNRLASLPPTLLGAMHALHTITITRNSMATLPDAIGLLTSLKFLDCSHNNLAKLPDTIGNLVNLVALVLQENQLECLPQVAMSKLVELASLNLRSNKLKRLPKQCPPNLQRMSIRGNSSLELDTNSREFINGLRSLAIDADMLASQFQPRCLTTPDIIINTPNNIDPNSSEMEMVNTALRTPVKTIEKLVLENVGSLEMIPSAVFELTGLKSLHIAGQRITYIPSTIVLLTQLDSLLLPQNKITRLPLELGELENLKTIDVLGNKITRLPLTLVKLKPQLKELKLDSKVLTFPKLSSDNNNLNPLDVLSEHLHEQYWSLELYRLGMMGQCDWLVTSLLCAERCDLHLPTELWWLIFQNVKHPSVDEMHEWTERNRTGRNQSMTRFAKHRTKKKRFYGQMMKMTMHRPLSK